MKADGDKPFGATALVRAAATKSYYQFVYGGYANGEWSELAPLTNGNWSRGHNPKEKNSLCRKIKPMQKGQWYAFDVTAAGQTIVCRVDSKTLFSWKDNRFSSGKVGIARNARDLCVPQDQSHGARWHRALAGTARPGRASSRAAPGKKGPALIFENRPTLTALGPRFNNKPGLGYVVRLEAGNRYVIELRTTKKGIGYDPYLVVLDPQGKPVAQDDDGGGGLNARIVYRPNAAGDYRIVATCLASVPPGGMPLHLTVKRE